MGVTPDCGYKDTGTLSNKQGIVLALTPLTTEPQLFPQTLLPTDISGGPEGAQEPIHPQALYGFCDWSSDVVALLAFSGQEARAFKHTGHSSWAS